jgi:uncharacterized protein involved in outer membrane biogenesis
MKTRKTLFLALGVVVVLIVVGAGLGALFIDSLAKAGIERGGTYAMGVKTTLGSASVGITSGKFGMSKLSVDNPPGYAEPKFLELGKGNVAVSLGSLTKDVVEVPTLELSEIRVDLERTSKGSNYQQILDNLKRFEGGGDTAKKESGGKKFVIKQVVIRDVKVRADLVGIGEGATAVTIPIHEIKLHNVGSAEGGMTTGEITATVVKAVLASAVAEGGGLIPGDIAGELKGGLAQLEGIGQFGVESIGQAGEAATKVAEEVGEAVQKAGEKIQEGVEGAVKGIGDLFGGKKK